RRRRSTTRSTGGTAATAETSGLGVLPELLAHDAAYLPDRRAVLQGRADRVEEVAVAAGHLAELLEPRLHRVGVAIGLELLQPLDLLPLGLGVDLQDLDVVDLVGDVLVHADDDVLLDPVALLVAPRRLLDLGPDERD